MSGLATGASAGAGAADDDASSSGLAPELLDDLLDEAFEFGPLLAMMCEAFSFCVSSAPTDTPLEAYDGLARSFLSKQRLTARDVRTMYLQSGINWDSFELETLPDGNESLKDTGDVEVFLSRLRLEVGRVRTTGLIAVRKRYGFLKGAAHAETLRHALYTTFRTRLLRLLGAVVAYACRSVTDGVADGAQVDHGIITNTESVITLRAHFHVLVTLLLKSDEEEADAVVAEVQDAVEECVADWQRLWPTFVSNTTATCRRLVKDMDKLSDELGHLLHDTEEDFAKRGVMLAKRRDALAKVREGTEFMLRLHAKAERGFCARCCSWRLLRRRALYTTLLLAEVVLIVLVLVKVLGFV